MTSPYGSQVGGIIAVLIKNFLSMFFSWCHSTVLQISHSRNIGAAGAAGATQPAPQPIPNARHLPKKPPSPAALNSLAALLEKSGKESDAIIAENRALRCQ